MGWSVMCDFLVIFTYLGKSGIVSQNYSFLKETNSFIFSMGKGLIVVLLLLLCSEQNTIMAAQWLCGRVTQDLRVSDSNRTGGTALCP